MPEVASSIHRWHHQRWSAQTLTTGLPQLDAVTTHRHHLCASGTHGLESVVYWIQVGAVSWQRSGGMNFGLT